MDQGFLHARILATKGLTYRPKIDILCCPDCGHPPHETPTKGETD